MTLNSNSFLDEMAGVLEENCITTVFGPPGVGKSTLCFQYVVSCLRLGKKVIYIDTEGGFSIERILLMDSGLDISNIVVFSPKSFEEQMKIIINLSKEINNNKRIGLVIVDSLVMLYRLKLGDDPARVNSDMGEQLRSLTEVARTHKIPVLVTNQMYVNFDTREKKMVGGSLIEYWSKTIIQLDFDSTLRRAKLCKHRFKKEGEIKYFDLSDQGLRVI